jgi:uncharacterized protein YhaN
MAGVEKRRYRHGYFVQTRTEKQKTKTEQQTVKTEKQVEPPADVITLSKKIPEQAEEKPLAASTLPSDKRNINKYNSRRTTFVNEHLKKSDQRKFHKKKINAKSNGTDELIFRLFLIFVLLLFLALAMGLKLLIPAMSLGLCYGISASIVLALLIFLFFGVKKSGLRSSE